jgi:6-phosphogluconate dehydrogenase
MVAMNICIIGLGRLGSALAYRLIKAGHMVIGYDPNETARLAVRDMGARIIDTLHKIPADAVVWLMVPAGKLVDDIIQEILPVRPSGSIIIEGGNSLYTDSMRRAEQCAEFKVTFLDCGTSGGVHGRTEGFSLMLGGDEAVVESLKPLWQALAAPQGYGYMGPSGAGHYVKMIHNGVEYALLQAYAEGFDLLAHGYYKNLDLTQITKVWSHGSIIRSWITELSHTIYERNPDMGTVSGKIDQSGTGAWTVQEAERAQVRVPMIREALAIRAWSQQTGGNYATKMVALLRHEFGGHKVHTTEEKS